MSMIEDGERIAKCASSRVVQYGPRNASHDKAIRQLLDDAGLCAKHLVSVGYLATAHTLNESIDAAREFYPKEDN